MNELKSLGELLSVTKKREAKALRSIQWWRKQIRRFTNKRRKRLRRKRLEEQVPHTYLGNDQGSLVAQEKIGSVPLLGVKTEIVGNILLI